MNDDTLRSRKHESALPWIGSSEACIVVAHPDDETLGCGGLCQRLSRVLFIHATDGCPADASVLRKKGFASANGYRQQRARELDAALALLPASGHARINLGFADQTLHLHVPALVDRLATCLRDSGITTVITHAFEGGHPDHDTLAFATAMAARRIKRVKVLEMPLYRQQQGETLIQSFPAGSLTQIEILTLSDSELGIKLKMLSSFSSQRRLLDRFDPSLESFRVMPAHKFLQTLTDCEVLYDGFGWPVCSRHVRAAMQAYLALL